MKRSQMLLLLMSLVGILSASCTPDQATTNDISETVFRYQFGHKADIYCIGLGRGSDPTSDFLKRFENNIPPVKKYSDCKTTDNLGDRFRDKTGKTVIFYFVYSVQRSIWGTATVEASWDIAPLWGESHRYTIKRINEKWTVTDDELTSVS